MSLPIQGPAFFLWLTLAACLSPALAQDPAPADEADASSQQVEESDEEFRRRMELEDARARDLGYPTPVDSSAKDLEKIDKLPEKSQNSIRDQLVDVIVENAEWEPFDALREYPYQPTAAAQADPELLQREQEAWDEQIEKYHEREAAAYGAQRGPVPGPGNPTGQEGAGQEGAGTEGGGQEAAEPAAEAGGEQGAGAGSGGQGDEQGGGQAGSSGTYQPYESNRSPATDEVSTAGAQQSALDFLRGQQGQAQPAASGTPSAPSSATPAGSPSAAGAQASEAPSESASASDAEPEAEPEVLLDTRGIIPIEDLDKLEGTELPPEPGEPTAPAPADEGDRPERP